MGSSRSRNKRKLEDISFHEQQKRSKIDENHQKPVPVTRGQDGLSEEVSFRQKNAAYFDIGTIDGVRVKTEQNSCDNDVVRSDQPPACSTPRRPHRTASLPARARPNGVNPTAEANDIHNTTGDRDDVFLSVLSQDWDLRMTNMMVDRVLQHARQCESPHDQFGLNYINDFIDRLDQRGISKECRTEVVAMLQEGLQEPLEHWQSRIRLLGREQSPQTVSSGSHAARAAHGQRNYESTPTSSRALYVDVPRLDTERHDDVDDLQGKENESEDGDEDASEYLESERETPASSRDSDPKAADGTETKSQVNIRLYGAPRPSTGFDMFARSIISAWALAPKASDSVASIREYAHSKWRKVPSECKSRWQALFEDRYNFGTDVANMARRLLKSQDLLAQVVPQDRLRAVELDLRQSSYVPGSSPPTASGLTSTPGFEQAGRLPSPVRSAAGNDPPYNHHDAPSKRYASGWLIQPHADCSDSEEISQVFPRLVQATPDTPITQACIVPTSARNHRSRRCYFILNTPDVRAYSDLTEHDLRAVCERAKLSGLKDVTRLSQNIFEVAFRSFSNADAAYKTTRISIEVPATTFTPFRKLNIRADWNWKHTLCVYVCDATKLPINHQTVIECVFDALQGPLVKFFSLHKQEKEGAEKVRFILRLSAPMPTFLVQRFYIPLDAADSDSKVWGIFRPLNRFIKCWACGARCQTFNPGNCPCEHQIGSG